MTESILLICIGFVSCIAFFALALTSVILSNHNITKHMQSIETTFVKLYNDSESRINQTNDMVYKLSSCIEKNENTLIIIANGYEHRIEKLQESQDKILKQNRDLAKQNTMLYSAATAPHINIANSTNNQ